MPRCAAYWPVLGLVLGPGEVLGVGLVVLGVSVPMPPADESEGMPDVPLLEVVPELLVPELPLMPESEPPPLMPAHAPSNIAQAIGNIHFVIDYSRKFRKAVRTAARTEGLHCECRE